MFPFYTPENIRKLRFSGVFRRYKVGTCQKWVNKQIKNYVVSEKMHKIFGNYLAKRSASISFTGLYLFDIRTAAKITLG